MPMLFDIVLPSVITAVTIIIVWLHYKVESKLKSLLEAKEFRVRDAFLLVIAMSVVVTIIVVVPHQTIQFLFLAAYSFLLFFFTYVAVEKWYLALLTPIVFVGLYFSPFWNIILLDLFAIVFAVFIAVYLSGLFSWITVLVFSALITVMDFIQVFATGFMGAAAEKFVELRLPVLIQVPTFPRQGAILLGLGDIFLTGLLAVQIALKYGKKAGVYSAVSAGLAFFLFEVGILNFEFAGFFPATLVVVFGWLLAFGIVYPQKRRTVGAVGGIACFVGALTVSITMVEVALELHGFMSILLVAALAAAFCVLIMFGSVAFIAPHVLQGRIRRKNSAPNS